MFLAFFLFHSFSQQLITAKDRFAKIVELRRKTHAEYRKIPIKKAVF